MSYPAPVARLLTLGAPSWSGAWVDYVALGLREDYVPDLIRMAQDSDLWNSRDLNAMVAPVHAWRALAQLRSPAAIPALLAILPEADNDDGAIGELVMDDFATVLAAFGAPIVPALRGYLHDSARNVHSIGVAGQALVRLAVADPAQRPAVLEAITSRLDQFAQNDRVLNAFLVTFLLDLKAVEAAPLIDQAYRAARVDEVVAGDLHDAQVTLGLKAPVEKVKRGPSIMQGVMSDATLRDEFKSIAANGKRKDDTKAKKAKRKQEKASRKQGRR